MRLLDNVESPRWRCNSCTPFSRTFRNYCIILTHILIISAKLNRGFRFQDHFGFCNNSAKFTDVCESGRVPPIPPQTMNTTMYDNSRCYCDSACMEYGDCCPDLVNLKDTRLLREMERRSKWSCHDLLVNTYYRVSI